MTSSIATTRRSWHAVAELVLAGPQHRQSGTIRLRIVPGGFATVTDPALQVIGGELVRARGSVSIDGRTAEELAAAAGVSAGVAEGVYHDGSGVGPDEELSVDPVVAARLAEAFGLGDAALRAFGLDQTPVLWPEHFDLGISMDEVNYGVSPGDGYCDEPYAYVGPWQARTGEFWNAPFGAARPLTGLSDVEAITTFFRDGRDHAAPPGRDR